MRRFGIELEVIRTPGNSSLTISDLRDSFASILATAVADLARIQPDIYDEVLSVGAGCEPNAVTGEYSTRNRSHQWLFKPDASCFAEIVSPPLELHQLMALLKRLDLSVLETAGYSVSAKTGFHVHVSDTDWTPERILEIGMLYGRYAEVLKAVIPSHRRNNSYCLFPDSSRVSQAMPTLVSLRYNLGRSPSSYSASSVASSVGYAFSSDRGALNFQPLVNGRKTLEFRCAAGTLRRELIVGWLSTIDRFLDLRCTAGLWEPRPYDQPETLPVTDRHIRALGPFALSRYREFHNLTGRAERIRLAYESRIRSLVGTDLSLADYGVREVSV